MANMPALKLLDLSDNGLTGTLPADWSGASKSRHAAPGQQHLHRCAQPHTITAAQDATAPPCSCSAAQKMALLAFSAILYADVCISVFVQLRADRSWQDALRTGKGSSDFG